MIRAILNRRETGLQGTFGTIAIPGLSLFTLERPWLGNMPDVSCIPTGLYQCQLRWSAHFNRRVYGLTQVAGRSNIEIHPANLVHQLNGCIALGERLGWIEKKRAVLLSQPAVRRFETLLGGMPFELEVKDGSP